MTLLYSDRRMLLHDTGRHPEHSGRLAAVLDRLSATGLDQKCINRPCPKATVEQIARIHDREYLQALEKFIATGGGRIEADTVCSPGSLDAALLAAGAVTDAVAQVLDGDDPRAVCLVRPPGHHALKAAPMGFCLLGNVAIGAKAATDAFACDRVLVVDWDVHHGNGTQDAFWTDGRIGFLSIHRWPFYPGTGREDETGAGDGLGTTLNLPIEFGTSRQHFLDAFRSGLESLAGRIRPQLVMISAGFDAHRLDPVGSLGLEVEDFTALTETVLDVADEFCSGRVVSVLEGGYDPAILADCVELHVSAMLRREAA